MARPQRSGPSPDWRIGEPATPCSPAVRSRARRCWFRAAPMFSPPREGPCWPTRSVRTAPVCCSPAVAAQCPGTVGHPSGDRGATPWGCARSPVGVGVRDRPALRQQRRRGPRRDPGPGRAGRVTPPEPATRSAPAGRRWASTTPVRLSGASCTAATATWLLRCCSTPPNGRSANVPRAVGRDAARCLGGGGVRRRRSARRWRGRSGNAARSPVSLLDGQRPSPRGFHGASGVRPMSGRVRPCSSSPASWRSGFVVSLDESARPAGGVPA